ncbi:MAG TPA: S9 family peptidase [Candidatus Cybelea sp.]|nr:S9 family peptidase [Candidatus Cybelea sp.]
MQTRRVRICAAWVVLISASVVSAQTRPSASEAPDAVHAMFDTHTFRQASVSPDGQRVAWVEALPGPDGAPSSSSAIYVASVSAPAGATHIGASRVRREANARARSMPPDEREVAWSPDGHRIAFLSDAAAPGQLELYVADLSAGVPAPRQLTKLRGFLSSPRWSPDGKTVGLLFIENATRAAGPLVAETPDEGVIEDKFDEQRLTLVDTRTGSARTISPADMYVYEFDWSPDGGRLVITAAHGNGDDNWWVAGLYAIEAASGATRVILDKPAMQIAEPRWSPDGRQIAFIGGLMSDQGVIGGDLYAVSAAGGQSGDLTPGIKESVSALDWAADSRAILFSGISSGETVIGRLGVPDGGISILWKGAERLSGSEFGGQISLARDRTTSAVIRQSYAQPPEVWAGVIGDWKQITRANAGLAPAWGKAESLKWTTPIGTVQGWLLYPANFDPGKKYPLVVVVHGGPASATIPSWPSRAYYMTLPSQGYFLLFPNPRGSYGEGEEFTRANVKDFGYGDWVDILAGVDQAIQSAPVDPHRLGITGWSYGGFMTMWGVTQTHRFRAAVVGAGLSDWLSYYGENKIDEWMIPYFGASVYDDPGVYAKSSPINYIRQAKTPTLIVVGDRDGECPAPQSFEFWHALKTLGVPTQLVVYPNEGHSFRNPAHTRDVLQRTIAWFNRYLQAD